MISFNASTAIGSARLAAIKKAVGPQVLLQLLELRFMAWVDKNFKDRGTESKWAPLRPSTLAQRMRGGDAPLMNTGNFRNAVQSRISGSTLRIGWPQDQQKLAAIHHYGSGPFTIVVKDAKILAARKRGGGWMFFGKEVHHPGIPRRPLIPSDQMARKVAAGTLNAVFDTLKDIK